MLEFNQPQFDCSVRNDNYLLTCDTTSMTKCITVVQPNQSSEEKAKGISTLLVILEESCLLLRTKIIWRFTDIGYSQSEMSKILTNYW